MTVPPDLAAAIAARYGARVPGGIEITICPPCLTSATALPVELGPEAVAARTSETRIIPSKWFRPGRKRVHKPAAAVVANHAAWRAALATVEGAGLTGAEAAKRLGWRTEAFWKRLKLLGVNWRCYGGRQTYAVRIAAIADGTLTAREIAERTGIPVDQVREVVRLGNLPLRRLNTGSRPEVTATERMMALADGSRTRAEVAAALGWTRPRLCKGIYAARKAGRAPRFAGEGNP